MTDAATIERPSTDIIALVEATPVMVLTDREKFSQFYDAIKRETDALDADVSTDKGRKAIASMAYRVARTKTAIDEAGKKLNEEARARINAVDESRREIRAQLDTLKDEVRRPLTEWEEAEEARQAECQQTITFLRESATIGPEETAADLRERHGELAAMTFNPEAFDGYMPQITALHDLALSGLSAGADRLDQEERDRAELERLRAAEAERERIEQERAAAEEAERQRVAAEKAEQEREQRLREETAEAARKEAEAAAAREQEERDRRHQEELAAERQRAEQAEAAERARVAEEARQAEEQKRREADREHRGNVMRAAKEALMEVAEIDEPTAKKIVLAIAANSIPAVSIKF